MVVKSGKMRKTPHAGRSGSSLASPSSGDTGSPDTEEATMARVSPDGPELVDQGPVEARTAELGGYTVDFVTFKQESTWPRCSGACRTTAASVRTGEW
jgi:hypothetical protein